MKIQFAQMTEEQFAQGYMDRAIVNIEVFKLAGQHLKYILNQLQNERNPVHKKMDFHETGCKKSVYILLNCIFTLLFTNLD